MNNYIELTEKLRQFAQENEKKARYEHSIRVAETCALLCRHYGLDDDKGYLAGIAHDICKYFSDDELILLAKKDKNPILEVELKNPGLLHGRAAAVLMQEKFKIDDKDIINAVSIHTSGDIAMCDLSKCLWLADKIEPGRAWSTDEYRNNLLKLSLDKVFYTVFLEYYEFALKKGYELYPNTKNIIEYYKNIVETGKQNEKN